MANQPKEHLPHLLVRNSAATEAYTSPRSGRAKQLKLPPRANRHAHAEALLGQLEAVSEQQQPLVEAQRAVGLDAGNGLYLQFESEPNFELAFESLEYRPSGIELLSVKAVGDRTVATVFVPEGKLQHFFRRIEQYNDPARDSPSGKPRHQALVSGIARIRLAALEALWTDPPELLPDDADMPVWWEAWLRVSNRMDYEAFVRHHAPRLNLHVADEAIRFLDRTVLLIRGSKAEMSRSVPLLTAVAELRRAKETADFFTGMAVTDQYEWVAETAGRIQPPGEDAPAVCVLDTGLSHTHPLLEAAVTADDVHAYHPDWGAHDHDGHGTEMAGLSLLGDLIEALSSNGPIPLSHKLESVKILPPVGDNERHLYGAITSESVARAEVARPNRTRVICMAVTADGHQDRGRPSSWSAEVDALSSGTRDDTRRLVLLSAGNTDPANRHLFPNSNLTDLVQDPGQAWNALTVGAYTEKVAVDATEFPGWTCVAPSGDLSPASCTSASWRKGWPIKPEIVMEGGNCAIHPTDGIAYDLDPLRLLSTGHDFLAHPIVPSGDTSAACGLAARLAAQLVASYPNYWPETVRGLLVHSANWTPAMRERFAPLRSRQQKLNLLRYCGYGVPDPEALFWSTRDSLTLVAQDQLQPFDRRLGSEPTTRDVNLHALPWPAEVLEALGETEVTMRVTLSYFVEPNPGERGWARRYRYASHGLRFEVKTATETTEQFRRRINEAARDEEHGATSAGDASSWYLGPDLRSLGSIHSDWWTGTAVELAARGHIAVYPVVGWWKERAHLERWGRQAPYALVVTISTPPEAADIYAPVATVVAPEVLV
jgi:hypothetical protein